MLQETAHRAGLKLPVYTTVRSGPGHIPVFTCTVELAGMNFNGEPAKTKKQAQKNAAMTAWSALKQCEPHIIFLDFEICLIPVHVIFNKNDINHQVLNFLHCIENPDFETVETTIV